LAHAAPFRTIRAVGLWVALALVAGAAPLAAQGTAPPSPPAQAALSFRAAMDLAISTNLELAAVRRARAIREAEVRAAGQRPNPEFSGEITRDTLLPIAAQPGHIGIEKYGYPAAKDSISKFIKRFKRLLP